MKNNPTKTKSLAPRKPNTPLSDPVRERYAGQRAMGLSQVAAFRTAKGSKKLTESSANTCASRMEAEPDVQARIAEITADMLKSSETYLTKAKLAEMISDELREAHKEPGMLSAASGLVDKYCKMFGFYEPDKIEAKLGCLGENEKNAKIAKLLKLNKS